MARGAEFVQHVNLLRKSGPIAEPVMSADSI
jgi:hypothetical protein